MTDMTRWATWREIHAQPDIWRSWGAALDVGKLRAWIAAQDVDEIWFTGAGTSAYIGDIIASGLEGTPGPRLRSIPSTDIVSRPQAYLRRANPLVVSFGRSGNSSESIGVLDALDALAPNAPRLNITCNKDGALAIRTSAGPQQVILLPDTTHDAGFAMTSSFSTMLLTALALVDPVDDTQTRCNALADEIQTLTPQFAATAGRAPSRAVFVGAGPMAFAAREAALKVMELSAGQIPALWDSTLGFRHGPKSFVLPGTMITVFTGPDPHAAHYDQDLTLELKSQFPEARVLSIGPGGDVDIPMPFGPTWAAPLSIAFAQIAGCLWAEELGLNVDDPFTGQGTLSRVVSGVTLYEVTP